MNDEAREVLVAAALRGHRQIRTRYHDPDQESGECAMGVLHLAMHGARAEALACAYTPYGQQLDGDCHQRLKDRFGLGELGHVNVALANDERRWDLLTIARKVGTEDGL